MNEIEQLLVKAQDAFDNGRLEEVMKILQEELLNDNLQAIFLKGESCYRLQKWGDALNCFTVCLEKNPLDVRAKAYVEMIRNILGFYHKDFFNP